MLLNNELLEVLEEIKHTSLSDKQTTMLYTDIPDIINRIKEKNPDTECVSWTTLAINIWHHLLTTCKVDPCFMPNFVVDDSRHIINNTANHSSYSTLASNCVHWRWYSDDDNVSKSIQLMMPTAYEIRVYTRAFDSYIKDHMYVCMILMANTLFHEFVHFFDNFVAWKKIFTLNQMKNIWKMFDVCIIIIVSMTARMKMRNIQNTAQIGLPICGHMNSLIFRTIIT